MTTYMNRIAESYIAVGSFTGYINSLMVFDNCLLSPETFRLLAVAFWNSVGRYNTLMYEIDESFQTRYNNIELFTLKQQFKHIKENGGCKTYMMLTRYSVFF